MNGLAEPESVATNFGRSTMMDSSESRKATLTARSSYPIDN
jgi:hypothetical protein